MKKEDGFEIKKDFEEISFDRSTTFCLLTHSNINPLLIQGRNRGIHSVESDARIILNFEKAEDSTARSRIQTQVIQFHFFSSKSLLSFQSSGLHLQPCSLSIADPQRW